MTLETPNTAPNAPWYLPRSLAGTMSPMIAWVSTMRPAAADALDGAEGDELTHVPGLAAESGPDEEDHDRAQEQVLAAVLVAELAPHLGGRGAGQQIRGDHPGQVAQPAEVADDRRQRGRHDRLVEGGQQQREHQCDVDDEQPAAVCLVGRPACGRRRPGCPCRRRRPRGRDGRITWRRHTELLPKLTALITQAGDLSSRRRRTRRPCRRASRSRRVTRRAGMPRPRWPGTGTAQRR